MIWDAIEPSLLRREDVVTAGWALAGAWAAGALMAGGWLLAACAITAIDNWTDAGLMLDLPWRALAGIVLISALAGAAFGEVIPGLAIRLSPMLRQLSAILAARHRRMPDVDRTTITYLDARVALETMLMRKIEP